MNTCPHDTARFDELVALEKAGLLTWREEQILFEMRRARVRREVRERTRR